MIQLQKLKVLVRKLLLMALPRLTEAAGGAEAVAEDAAGPTSEHVRLLLVCNITLSSVLLGPQEVFATAGKVYEACVSVRWPVFAIFVQCRQNSVLYIDVHHKSYTPFIVFMSTEPPS